MSEPVVTLRALEFEDWETVYGWGRQPAFCRYQPWGPDTAADARAFVEAALADGLRQPRDRFAYLALRGDEPIGLGEMNVRNRRQRQGELAYGVDPEMWGRGLGTAIARALLAIGFERLGLHRVCGTCDPRNVGSARVLTKIGMTYEGRLRHTALIRDGWRDSEVFSVLEDEWRAANA